MAVEYRRMQSLRGSTSEWAANNIIPLIGELSIEYAASRTRIKAGDSVNAFSVLPYIGEQDDTARAAVAVEQGRVTSLTVRMDAAEVQTAQIAPLTATVSTIQTAMGGKQSAFAPGTSTGDLITWNGTGWVPIAVGAIGGSVMQFDATSGRWLAVPKGAPGYVLTTSPTGTPAWLPNASVTVRTITIAGTGNVWDDFNAAAPTIQSGELVIVTHNNVAYVYSGPPGSNITNSTSFNFTSLGASTHYAEMDDFTTPPGGATDRAVSPSLLLSWIPNVVFDAGTY